VDFFFLAGYEATSTTLAWAFHFLAKYPEHQEKIFKEMQEHIGDADVTHEHLKNLDFLEMFLKEVLRIQPAFPLLLSRIADTTKEIDGIIVPPGTRVTVNIHAIHHLPEFWPEPEKFDPYRFTEENSANRHPFAYLPFSEGRRHCPGNMFAILEQKVLLAMVIRKFEIGYIQDALQYNSGIFNTPSSVMVTLKPREVKINARNC